jgi:hypothetical protein
MVSLMASKSWASLRSALSDASNKDVPALAPRSPTRSVSSVDSNYDSRSIATSSSSNDSFSPDAADEGETYSFPSGVAIDLWSLRRERYHHRWLPSTRKKKEPGVSSASVSTFMGC